MVKRILNKHGYPPDLQEEAVKTVLMQAELLCAEWVLGKRGAGTNSKSQNPNFNQLSTAC